MASFQEKEELFLRALCLCPTVQVKEPSAPRGAQSQLDRVMGHVDGLGLGLVSGLDGDGGQSEEEEPRGFIASSPDEVALVKGAMK